MIVLFDIDGVIRDVGGSYRRALADTVEKFTAGQYRPTPEAIDRLKGEGQWNNDWEASQELIYRHFATQGQGRDITALDYAAIVAFFQSKYRGEVVTATGQTEWTGYICQEPLLVTPAYFEELTQANVAWGFFSGATRASATFVLTQRLGLANPLLIAMEDAPGKPDPTGLFLALEQLNLPSDRPVVYVGDTVADMYTIAKARELNPERTWIAIGVLPPHVQDGGEIETSYNDGLKQAGAQMVLKNVEALTPALINTIGIN
jgi:HAD superfamily phosphatase